MTSTDQPSESAPTSRRRQREATRSAILDAARQAWAEHGYDDVGLRDIAGRAGVTAAMVNRYFGSKKELFREAVGTRDPSPPTLAGLDHADFGRHLADLITSGGHRAAAPDEDDYDPILILLRSAASHAARPVLRDYVENTVIPPLAGYFGDDDSARERAALVLSLLLGMTALGRMLGVEPLDTTAAQDGTAPDRRGLNAVLAAMLQAAADTTPPAATPPPPDRL
ncbi:TetR/AcrR family transcriptional regulator [Streptomyces sp. AHA2]|uniref:TetR/AcrR family transcriptional regulator n=1 Tax=Streptomyces sp. AHA2 TaxID=3064526 RepID=UPI002FE2865A